MSFSKYRWRCLFALLLSFAVLGAEERETDSFSGLAKADNWQLVLAHCMACHSTRAITQSQKDRKGWEKTLKTMQQKEGLYPLGDAEEQIIDYLTTQYGRRDEPYNPKIRRPLER